MRSRGFNFDVGVAAVLVSVFLEMDARNFTSIVFREYVFEKSPSKRIRLSQSPAQAEGDVVFIAAEHIKGGLDFSVMQIELSHKLLRYTSVSLNTTPKTG
jgi:hypothetical protein